MRRKFTFIYSWILLIVLSVSVDSSALSAPQYKQDTTSYLFGSKKVKKKNPLSLSMPPIRAGVVSTQKANVIVNSDKILTSVEVYPNPIVDQINLKYIVSRNTNVSIKIVDVLGNNIVTLFSQRVEPGEQTFSYALNNKLTRGFYFVRVVAGTEFVIRRISVL